MVRLRDDADPDRAPVPGGPDSAAAVPAPGRGRRAPAHSHSHARRAARRLPAPDHYAGHLLKAAPQLLSLARERAAELADAIRLVPCVGPTGVGPCISCSMRAELDRINGVIHEVEDLNRPVAGPRRQASDRLLDVS